MLNTWFQINMPYGMFRKDNDKWVCFNREYKQLGTPYRNNIDGTQGFGGYDANAIWYNDNPVHYIGLSESFILTVCHYYDNGEPAIRRDINRNIDAFWFYQSYPIYKKDFDIYCNKLFKISKLKKKKNGEWLFDN